MLLAPNVGADYDGKSVSPHIVGVIHCARLSQRAVVEACLEDLLLFQNVGFMVSKKLEYFVAEARVPKGRR